MTRRVTAQSALRLQAEPRAALSLAARGQSPLLKLSASDLVLYSAKVSPLMLCLPGILFLGLCMRELPMAEPPKQRGCIIAGPRVQHALLFRQHASPSQTTFLPSMRRRRPHAAG